MMTQTITHRTKLLKGRGKNKDKVDNIRSIIRNIDTPGDILPAANPDLMYHYGTKKKWINIKGQKVK